MKQQTSKGVFAIEKKAFILPAEPLNPLSPPKIERNFMNKCGKWGQMNAVPYVVLLVLQHQVVLFRKIKILSIL